MKYTTQKSLELQEKASWVRLIRSTHISRNIFFRLLSIFESPQNALDHIKRYSLSEDPSIICPEEIAMKEIENTEKFGAKIITFHDKEYPKLLREISDPPPILTVKGNIDLLNKNTIAIVGPRNSSLNAQTFAYNIAKELGEKEITIASGMARGVDRSAHLGSIKSGTIAVIAGGIDHIYPKDNTDIYHQIAEEGLLVSEQPFGSFPKGGNFPQRNRIISGLSLGAVIVEATLKSGTLITARFAEEQNRELFAVPGFPLDPRCQGTNRLIKKGAKLIENIDDIIEEIKIIKEAIRNKNKFGESDIPTKFNYPPINISDGNEILKAKKAILTQISYTPIAIDKIINQLQIPVYIVNVALIQLELEDKINNKNGKICLKC